MDRAVHRQKVLLGPLSIPVQFPCRPIWCPIRNASQVSDGAAAVLLMKRRMALQGGLPILGVFRSFAAVGVEPSVMGIGPAVAIPAAVKSAGLERLLKRKLRMIYQGEIFNGKSTKTARSQGNLGWVYMQKSNYMAAEFVYKKAQMIDPDANKAGNFALKLGRHDKACPVLKDVLRGRFPSSDDPKPRSCFFKSSHGHGRRSSSQISSATGWTQTASSRGSRGEASCLQGDLIVPRSVDLLKHSRMRL